MSFNFFMTKRVLRVGQYDGIHDFVAFDLSGEKRPLVQFLVGEFHSSAICKRLNPLVAHSAPPRWRFSRDKTPLRLKIPEAFHASLISNHARLGNVKNVSAGISDDKRSRT